MRNTTLSSAMILALAGTLALAGCKKKEDTATVDSTATPAATETAPAPAEPAPPAAAPAAAPVTVSSVAVGNTAAADKTVTPATTLASKDKIIVSVKTDGTASNVPVAAKLTFQDGQVAGEQSATLNTTGAETTNIEFSKPSGWPAGKYKAEVMVDGKPAGTAQDFTVK